MNIHEYQAKELLSKYNVPIPRGKVAFTAEEAEKAARELGSPILVVKSQIHAGGRGKGKFKNSPNGAGGVRVVKSIEDVKKNAAEMLGQVLVTHQTGPEGKEVQKVYIEEGSNIEKEYYFSIVVDRNTSRVTLMASSEGGMDIEEVAAHHPEKIITADIDPASGLQGFHLRKIAFALGLPNEQHKAFAALVTPLYDAFIATDASQVEINPLVLTKEGKFLVLDAKFNLDENALFRHPDIAAMKDETEEDPFETRAAEFGLSYVKMDGNIGCMVNGAGLAMSTMDIIKLYGAEPANFLDVGGGANKEKVTEAFKIILADPAVKGILVNIFGGIMKCDIIAEGVIAAAREIGLSVPLVVRLAGTNVELGRKMLDNSGLPIVSASDLDDAAEKIVKAIQQKAA